MHLEQNTAQICVITAS